MQQCRCSPMLIFRAWATCEDKRTFLWPKYNALFKNIFFVSLIWSQWAFFKHRSHCKCRPRPTKFQSLFVPYTAVFFECVIANFPCSRKRYVEFLKMGQFKVGGLLPLNSAVIQSKMAAKVLYDHIQPALAHPNCFSLPPVQGIRSRGKPCSIRLIEKL